MDFKEASSKNKRQKKTLTIERWVSITETGNVCSLAWRKKAISHFSRLSLHKTKLPVLTVYCCVVKTWQAGSCQFLSILCDITRDNGHDVQTQIVVSCSSSTVGNLHCPSRLRAFNLPAFYRLFLYKIFTIFHIVSYYFLSLFHLDILYANLIPVIERESAKSKPLALRDLTSWFAYDG